MPDPLTIAAIGGLGLNAAGSIARLFSSDNSEEQHRAALALQREYAEKNIALQREFAKSGIQWKIEDAKKAGIHPVAALGASGTSFSPVSVGDVAPPQKENRWADFLGDMGQNVSRAVQATASMGDRLDMQMKEEQLKGLKLDNALRSQRLGPPAPSQVGPAMPTEPVIQPDVSYVKTTRGGLAPVPSEAFADRAEDQWLPQIAWGLRNLIAPEAPENRGLAPGEVWMWNPMKFEYERGVPDSFGITQRLYNKALRWSQQGKTYKERQEYAKTQNWHPPLYPARKKPPSWTFSPSSGFQRR